ncbi:MAG: discoidin domain-containing protein, partial [Muribaculaceae bacterium]|nr:discoidin domain-containing protein [Muribaculaceae bacterium]
MAGTALSDLPLPETVSVTTSGTDGSGAAITADAPITWTCEDYDAATAGTYTFTGVLGSDTLTNPGCFTLTATVTVRAAEGGTTASGSLLPESPTDNANVWASGMEVTTQNPAKAIDGSTGTLWSGNKMKDKDGSTLYDTLENAVSWLTVDLGENVESISQIVMQYNANVWPTDYYIQAGGSSISYDGYTTPGDATTYSTDDTTNRHTKNGEGWVDLYRGTRTAVSDSNPTFTVNSTDFTTALPSGTRYLRLYFTGINSYARAGTGIGLKELAVTGTRAVPP